MNLNKNTVKNYAILIFSGIFFYWALQHLNLVKSFIGSCFSLMAPFIVGAAIAFIINVPMNRIDRLCFKKENFFSKYSRLISYTITLVLVIGVLSIVTRIVVPELVNTLQNLAMQIPAGIDRIQSYIKDNMDSISTFNKYIDYVEIDWDLIAKKAVNVVQNAASSIIDSGFGIVGGFVSGLASFLIGFVFSVYVLFQKEKLSSQCRQILYAMLPRITADKTMYVLSLTNTTFSKFLSGQCVEAAILGGLFFISMTILKMPYALLISVLIGVMALIPIVGAFIGCFVGVLLILLVDPMQALFFLILFLIIQQIEGNLIYPHVVGGSVGLPSIWVLVAITIGGKLMGIMGMLIFIPIVSVAYSLFRTFIKEKLWSKNIDPTKI